MATENSSVSTSELFINFVQAYQAIYDPDKNVGQLIGTIAANVSDTSTTPSYAWFDQEAKVDPKLEAEWEDNTPLGSYDYETSCEKIYEAQQRLWNVYNNPNYNTNSLQSVNPHNRFTAIFKMLYYDNINSSFDVVSISEDTFVDLYYNRFLNYSTDFTEEQKKQAASMFYAGAANIKSQVMIQYMGVVDATNDGRIVPWNNYGSNYANLPTYQDLFNQRAYLEVDEGMSVLSPSAYLVDMDKCADDYVTAAESGVDVSAQLIRNRRPDIFEDLELNTFNTNTEISKLQIVNALLLKQCQTIGEEDAASISNLNGQAYPLSAPYNYYLEKLRPALSLQETSLNQLWKLANPSVKASSVTNLDLAVNLEVLGINQAMYDEILSMPINEDQDARRKRYGLTGSSAFTVSEILGTTFIPSNDLANIIYGDLSNEEINSDLPKNQPLYEFYISGWYPDRDLTEYTPIKIGYDDNGDQIFENNIGVRLDKVNRLIRLSQSTGMSYQDLNWAITVHKKLNNASGVEEDPLTVESFYNQLAAIKSVMEDFGLTSTIHATALYGLIKDFGKGDSGETPIQSLFGFVAPTYCQDSDFETWDLATLISGRVADEETTALMRGTHLSLDELILLGTACSTQFGATTSAINLDQDFLSALYRGSLASRLLNMDMETFLMLLTQLGDNEEYLAFLGSSSALVTGGGTDLLVSTFQALQSFSSLTENYSDLSLEDIEIMSGNHDEAYAHSIPGLSTVKELILEVQSTAPASLLTQERFAQWLAPYMEQEEYANLSPAGIYVSMVSSDIVDKLTATNEEVFEGVVLKIAIPSGGDGDTLPTSLDEPFKEMLRSYRALQNEVITGVFGDALEVSGNTNISGTISNWKNLLVIDSTDIDEEANNTLHQFYSKAQLTMSNEGKAVEDLVASDVSSQTQMLVEMNRCAVLINALNLTYNEVVYLINRNITFYDSSATEFAVNMAGLQETMLLQTLTQAYSDADNNLIHYLTNDSFTSDEAVRILALATGWEELDINSLLGSWDPVKGTTSGVELVNAMAEIMDLATSMNASVETITGTTALVGDAAATAYESLAEEMVNVLYESNNASDADAIENSLSVNLDESYRDVLAGSLLEILRNYTSEDGSDEDATAAYYHNLTSFTDLSQFLLTDIEVTGKFTTSKVREAISAYSMYFHRIEMNMEPGLKLDNDFRKNEYIWKQDYRIWEANRKVFLNPENYVQPELRKEASQAFTNFANEVSQADPNDENVETAFHHYLQNFQTVGNLSTVGSFMQLENGLNVILFVGRTLNQPYEYYTRKLYLTLDESNGNMTPYKWTPWVNPSAAVVSPFVQMIQAFHTVFMFWVEFEPVNNDEDTSKPAYQAIIKYIFLQVDNQWSPVQDLVRVVDFTWKDVNYQDLVDDSDYNQLTLSEQVLGNESDVINVNYKTNDTETEVALDQYFNVLTEDDLQGTSAENPWDVSNIRFLGDETESNDIKYVSRRGTNRWIKTTEYTVPDFISDDSPSVTPLSEKAYYFDQQKTVDGDLTGLSGDSIARGFTLYNKQLIDVTVGFWYMCEDLSVENLVFEGNYNSSTSVSIVVAEGRVSLKKHSTNLTISIESQSIKSGEWIYICFSYKQWIGINNPLSFFIGGYANDSVYEIGSIQYTESTSIGMETATFTASASPSYIQHIQIVNKYLRLPSLESEMELLAGLSLSAAPPPVGELFTHLSSTSTHAEWVAGSLRGVFTMNPGTTQYLGINYNDSGESKWRFIRMSSQQASMSLVENMRLGGVSELLSIDTQLTSEDSFSDYGPDKDQVPEAFWPDDDNIDIKGANATYYWELFCFAPWLVANNYENAGDFSNSNTWLRYIFDPSIRYTDVSEEEQNVLDIDQNENDIYWRFIGLRTYYDSWVASSVFAQPQGRLLAEQSEETLSAITSALGSSFSNTLKNQALTEYNDDPFAPHAIAYLRPIAYQKAIVMNMVKAKLEWADRLYTQATRDTIMQAVVLYLEINDLLGNKPEANGAFAEDNQVTENSSPDRKLSTINDTYTYSNIPDFLVGLEGDLDLINGYNNTTAGNANQDPFNFIPGLYFGVPENLQVLSFWKTVAQRLSNIRNSLDINGNPLNLNLFEPAINPMALVSAIAGGANLSDAINSVVNAATPIYRYSVLLSKAKEFAGMVSSFGQSLLSAIEKKDNEHLNKLQLTQQNTILEMTLEMKQLQIGQMEAQLEAVVQSMVMASTRFLYYDKLLEHKNSNESGSSLSSDSSGSHLLVSPLEGANSQTETLEGEDGETTTAETKMDFANSIRASQFENESINLTISSIASQVAASITQPLAAIKYGIPNIFGTANGGSNLGGISSAIAQGFRDASNILGMSSGLSSTRATFKRREQDWIFQKELAQAEMEQVKQNYLATSYQLESARDDYQITQTQIQQNEEILGFYRNKFSNESLYQWMQGYLTSTYFQSYRLALDMGLEAQHALCYELGYAMNDVNLVNTGSWNNNYEGLLSGEMLTHSLNLLDKYYMDKNSRRLEITKTFTKTDLATTGIVDNKDGSYTLDIINSDASGVESDSGYPINGDYTGAYRMQVKMVTVSIPTLLAPYQDIQALLTHSGNIIYDKDNNVVRSSTGDGQQLAISMGQEDSGLFQANFDDPRYLPFEGTGIMGKWVLSFQNVTDEQKDLISNISDIIIRIRYTAEV